MVFRMGNKQFSGPIQLLPIGASSEQAESAMKSLVRNLGGVIPSTGHEKLKLARDAFAWQEYRTSTKNLLCAMGNSLQQVMPEGWSLAQCKPGNLLGPRSADGERIPYLTEEKELVHHPLPSECQTFFIYDFKSQQRRPDFYIDEDFYRLVVSCDEGTEVGGKKHTHTHT